MTSDGDMSRRTFLRASTGATALVGVVGQTTAQKGQTHVVEMTDDLVFDPDSLTITPAETVVWENVGSVGHSVTAYESAIPGGAEYFASGGFDAEQPARDGYPDRGNVPGGESYEHTFDVEGAYDYFCIPHETTGMVGTIEVTEGGGETGDDGSTIPGVPDAAKRLAIVATAAMLSTVGFAYVFLKYGGERVYPEDEMP